MLTMSSEDIIKGRLFKLTNELTGENDQGLPTVIYGSTDDVVITTGRNKHNNAFEVILVKEVSHLDYLHYYSPFIVTLNDINDVSMEELSSYQELGLQLLNKYDEDVEEREKLITENLVEKMDLEIHSKNNKITLEYIIDLMDKFADENGGHYTLGYMEEG